MHCCRQDVEVIKLMREGWELMPSTCSEFTMKHQQLKQTCITFHQDLIAQQAKFEDKELLDTYYCCSCFFPKRATWSLRAKQLHNVITKKIQPHKTKCRPPLVQLQLYEEWFHSKKDARTCPPDVKKWKKHVSENCEHPDMIHWELRPPFEKPLLAPPNNFHNLDKYMSGVCVFISRFTVCKQTTYHTFFLGLGNVCIVSVHCPVTNSVEWKIGLNKKMQNWRK